LLQAFCYENDIHAIQVHTSLDMTEKCLSSQYDFNHSALNIWDGVCCI
jgi:hypothetical protein